MRADDIRLLRPSRNVLLIRAVRGGRERLGEIPAEDEILAEYLGHAGEILASETMSRSGIVSSNGHLSEGVVPSEKGTRKRVNPDQEVVTKRKSSKNER